MFNANEAKVSLKAHPGWEFHWRLVRFETVQYAFETNANDIISWCATASREVESIEQESLTELRPWLHTMEPRLFLLLINFGATQHMLVETSRQISRDFLAGLSRVEYIKKVSDLFATPEMEFIKGLRNFVQHSTVPSLQLFLFQEDSGRRIQLNADSLLRNKRAWTSQARSFLEGQDVAVDISLWLDQYQEKSKQLSAYLKNQCLGNRGSDLVEFYGEYDRYLRLAKESGGSFENIIQERWV